ncbi:MAG: SLBB domain-containing protein, partial [Bacteroidota bacterium]
SLQRNTFAERGTLFRLLPNLRKEVLAFNPRLAIGGDPSANILLQNEDSLIVYKESQFFPEHMVTIGGAIRNPGNYTRNDSMTVADLVVLAGGLTEEGTTEGWELSRIDTTTLGVYSKLFKLDMPAEYWNRRIGNAFFLQDFDFLFIPAEPKFSRQRIVNIAGYAMYPGPYALQNGQEKLADLIGRAGGLKPEAYLEGSVLFRKLNNAGLIPIDFRSAIDDPSSRDNVVMNDGDSVYVAFHEDVVYVRGEVFVPSAALYKKGGSLEYYLGQAGGLREEGDRERVVVFLPGGKKWEPRWFLLPDPEILPGSSIFVPRKIEKPDNTLPVLRDMATILASLAAITIGIIQITK